MGKNFILIRVFVYFITLFNKVTLTRGRLNQFFAKEVLILILDFLAEETSQERAIFNVGLPLRKKVSYRKNPAI